MQSLPQPEIDAARLFDAQLSGNRIRGFGTMTDWQFVIDRAIESGLSPRRLQLLHLICRRKRRRPRLPFVHLGKNEVARVYGRDLSNVSRDLRLLRQAGWLAVAEQGGQGRIPESRKGRANGYVPGPLFHPAVDGLLAGLKGVKVDPLKGVNGDPLKGVKVDPLPEYDGAAGKGVNADPPPSATEVASGVRGKRSDPPPADLDNQRRAANGPPTHPVLGPLQRWREMLRRPPNGPPNRRLGPG